MGQARGCAKAGRDKIKCQRYLMKMSREENRIRRLVRLVRRGEKMGWKSTAQIKTALNKWTKFKSDNYAKGVKGRGWRP